MADLCFFFFKARSEPTVAERSVSWRSSRSCVQGFRSERLDYEDTCWSVVELNLRWSARLERHRLLWLLPANLHPFAGDVRGGDVEGS